jgi:glucosamine kinase
MRGIYIGIDGGGTRTTAVATDREGRELARLEGGAALVRSTNPTAGAAALADLTDRLLHRPGAAPPATAICCALAGAGRHQDRTAIAAALQREAIAERVRVVTDADAAFHDAFGTAPGILLIAGTGSIALGRAADRRTARVGGWGTLLGDEGSGYALGLAALRASARAHDGRGPETALLPAFQTQLALAAAEDLIHWTASATKREIAALAPIVLAAADEGDGAARIIADGATRELVGHLDSLIRVLAPWHEPPTFAFAGGLIAPSGPLRTRLVRSLEAAGPGLSHRLLDRAVDAARGAATLARGG